MSDYAYVADRARKAFSSVARLESELLARPSDRALEINLMSMRRVAERAAQEMEQLASKNQIEICRYRLIPAKSQEYALGNVARTLLEYQNLFSQIYDSLRYGKKSRAIISPDAASESEMNLAYTYSGSLGVVLLARSQRDFFEGNLDRSIDAFYKIMSINDEQSIVEVSQVFGRAVVKRIHDWCAANVSGGFAADIQWKKADGSLRGQVIPIDQLERIAKFIVSSSEEDRSEIKTRAILVGADIVSRRFHLSEPGGESYQGIFCEDFPLPTRLHIGRMYNAKIVLAERYFFATDKTSKAFSLKELKFAPK